jgi:hypothetical protein
LSNSGTWQPCLVEATYWALDLVEEIEEIRLTGKCRPISFLHNHFELETGLWFKEHALNTVNTKLPAG